MGRGRFTTYASCCATACLVRHPPNLFHVVNPIRLLCFMTTVVHSFLYVCPIFYLYVCVCVYIPTPCVFTHKNLPILIPLLPRLARTNSRIRSITLRACSLSADMLTQINAALKDNDTVPGQRRPRVDTSRHGTLSSGSGLPSPTPKSPCLPSIGQAPSHRNSHAEGLNSHLPYMVHTRKTTHVMRR